MLLRYKHTHCRNHAVDILTLNRRPERTSFIRLRWNVSLPPLFPDLRFPVDLVLMFYLSLLLWNSRNARQIRLRKEVIHAQRARSMCGRCFCTNGNLQCSPNTHNVRTLMCAYTYLVVSLKRNNEREWTFPAASNEAIFTRAGTVQIFTRKNHRASLISSFR